MADVGITALAPLVTGIAEKVEPIPDISKKVPKSKISKKRDLDIDCKGIGKKSKVDDKVNDESLSDLECHPISSEPSLSNVPSSLPCVTTCLLHCLKCGLDADHKIPLGGVISCNKCYTIFFKVEGEKILPQTNPKLEMEKAKAEIEEAKAETEKAMAEIEKAKVEIEKAKVEIEEATAKIEEAKTETEKAKAETEKAKAEIEKSKTQIEIAKAEIEIAKSEIEKAKAEIEAKAEMEKTKVNEIEEKAAGEDKKDE